MGLRRKYELQSMIRGVPQGFSFEIEAEDACHAVTSVCQWTGSGIVEVKVVNTGEIVKVELQSNTRTIKLVES